MWREIKKVAKDKPLVATMGDVAASGGYYMAMAAPTVLAHPLTITGSIGVVTGKFNLAELYDRVPPSAQGFPYSYRSSDYSGVFSGSRLEIITRLREALPLPPVPYSPSGIDRSI